MSCRTPGGVVDPEGYWALLREGRDAIGPFPERWDTDALFDPDPEAIGKSYAREGGFLRDMDQFDSGFFGISPREAVAMDPQQRLMLETSVGGVGARGTTAGCADGSTPGVYLGLDGLGLRHKFGCLAWRRSTATLARAGAAACSPGGCPTCSGCRARAMTVDTACSSSLVAVHLACQALRQGECDLALAGGVNVMLHAERLRGLQPAARAGARRSVPELLGGGGRRGVARGLRRGGAQAAVGRASGMAIGCWR